MEHSELMAMFKWQCLYWQWGVHCSHEVCFKEACNYVACTDMDGSNACYNPRAEVQPAQSLQQKVAHKNVKANLGAAVVVQHAEQRASKDVDGGLFEAVRKLRLERPEATAKELHVALAACGWTDVSFPKVKTVAARVSEEAGAPLPVAQSTNPETAIGATWEPP